jgi:hypothetical protein
VELREKLTATGLDAGPDTIVWHLYQLHGHTVSPGHRVAVPGQARAGRPRAEEATEVVLHPVPGGAAQRMLAGGLHPLPAHPPRRPARTRHRDLVLARRLLPVRALGHRPCPGHRPDRAHRVPHSPLPHMGFPRPP